MTTCTEHIRIDCSPEEIGSFLRDVHNLPTWTGFFRSVGRPVGDRFEVKTAMGTTIRTRIEHGDDGRYAISSLVGDREERAELVVATVAGGVDVSFTVNVLPALANHAAGTARDGAGDGTAIQRGRMRDELQRLRSAVSAVATVPRHGDQGI
ncbi:MAG: SRPBCC family protein [Chloroflexi bacterium]|nr:SRPBCC family protein [Chloroflexota bacterium]